MREIKFRAWDSRSKAMFNVDVLAISPCAWSCPDYGTRGVSLAYQPNIEVMQFTGLRDRHGKEIYEGDILRYWNPSVGSIIRPIVFKWGGFGIEGLAKGTHIYFGNLPEEEIEVIGNIYENPELLEVSQ